jgi:hypothetical protein
VGTYDAIAMFNFYGGRLMRVVVQIPKQEVPVNRTACTRGLLENEVAKDAAGLLRAGLEVKYGKSRTRDYWLVPEDTAVSLFVKPQPDGVHTWVGIIYSRFDPAVE